jgi:hypothetical protein
MADDYEGNVQDMSVHDKEHPALAATEEAQDVASLNRIVVPMGSYVDPNNPAAAAGSVNLSLDSHPVTHSDDYGQSALEDAGVEEDERKSAVDMHADEAAVLDPGRAEAGKANSPADRAEWQKKDWVAQARSYGLNVSGNVDAVRERVEEHEAGVEDARSMSAEDWKNAVADADAEELGQLHELYKASGSQYSTVDQAFDKRQAELSES